MVSAGGAPVVAKVSATVDGQVAQVVYCGASAGQVAGALQISLRLPFAVHGTVPVVVTMGGQSSQATATVSIQ
jgi:uncharacterized protein (TIGR03437 family)